jgi:hypothetical protein
VIDEKEIQQIDTLLKKAEVSLALSRVQQLYSKLMRRNGGTTIGRQDGGDELCRKHIKRKGLAPSHLRWHAGSLTALKRCS